MPGRTHKEPFRAQKERRTQLVHAQDGGRTAAWVALAAIAALALAGLPTGGLLAGNAWPSARCPALWSAGIGELRTQLTSHRELRYENVTGQSDVYSCGPAAIATLLTHYFHIEASERDCLELAEGFVGRRGGEPGDPLTALDLLFTMEALGLPAQGYRVTVDSLADYFQRGGPPVIAHVTRPQNHFLLVVGTIGDQVVLADPSWGTRIEPLAALERQRGFSGVVLVPLPDEPLAATAHRRQSAVLRQASTRVARLRQLREDLP